MSLGEHARELVRRWARLLEGRDVEHHADLFLRDPAPVVTFSDGHRAADWLDVRIRVKRDLERVAIGRVEVHDISTQPIADDVVVVSFQYDLHVRDMWGTDATAHRIGTVTLARTKDGLRIAAAHYADRRE